jgi:hypothetical protein
LCIFVELSRIFIPEFFAVDALQLSTDFGQLLLELHRHHIYLIAGRQFFLASCCAKLNPKDILRVWLSICLKVGVRGVEEIDIELVFGVLA